MVNSNKDLWPGRTGLVQKGPARRPAVQNGQENAWSRNSTARIGGSSALRTMLQLWRNSAALNDLRRESCELDTALGGPVAFAPDGKHAVLCKFARDKRYLTYWNIAGSKEIRQIGDDSLWPAEVGFCGEDKVVCRSREGRLVCWNTKGEQLWETKSTNLQD